MERIHWRGLELERAKLHTLVEAPAMLEQVWWEQHWSYRLKNAYQVNYAEMDSHPAFVPAERRTDWEPTQIAEV